MISPPPLKTLYLYITRRCNMKCEHCWISADPNRTENEVTYAELRRAICKAKQLGLQTVKISGGEPFLRLQLVKKLLKLLFQLNLKAFVESNGTLIDKDKVKLLKIYNVASIGISLDFPDEARFEEFRHLKGSFKRVLRTMSLLASNNIQFESVATIVRSNIDCLPHIAELAFGLGAKSFKINPCLTIGRAKNLGEENLTSEDYGRLVSAVLKLNDKWPGRVVSMLPLPFVAQYGRKHFNLARVGCHYKNLLGILPNGDVSLCGTGICHPEAIIGNVKRDDMDDMWNSNNEFLTKLRSLEPEKFRGVCGECMFRSNCANLCPAFVYDVYGDLQASYPICQSCYDAGFFPEKYVTSITH